MSTPTLTKLVGESRTYAFDYSRCAEVLSGQTLTGTPTVTASPSGLTIGSPSIAGSQVAVQISSGTLGQTYLLSCLTTTSGGSTVGVQGNLSIVAMF